MRILHLVHQYPPEFVGGTELYTQTLARGLAGRGHPAAVFTRSYVPRAGAHEWDDHGVPVYAASAGAAGPTQRFLATFGESTLAAAFGQALDHFQPDLVHVQHLMGLPGATLDLLRARGLPYVVTLLDFWWFCANAQLVTNFDHTVCAGPAWWTNCTRCAVARSGTPLAWAAAPLLWPLLAQRGRRLHAGLAGAARCLATTEFVKQIYVGQGMPPDHVQVVTWGVDAPPDLPRRPAGDRRGPLQIAYIGGVAWQKGLHVLVDAVSRLPGECELWLAGDLEIDREYAQRLAAMAGPGVHFLGRLGRDQVWELLAQVDVVAVPSLWYETFSLLAHEAYAAGAPVVASNLGVLAQVVHHEVDGLLVPTGDVAAWEATLHRLATSPELIAALRRQITPPLTVDQHVDRVLEVYEQVAT